MPRQDRYGTTMASLAVWHPLSRDDRRCSATRLTALVEKLLVTIVSVIPGKLDRGKIRRGSDRTHASRAYHCINRRLNHGATLQDIREWPDVFCPTTIRYLPKSGLQRGHPHPEIASRS